MNDDERKRLAQETLDIYAPLANRLGIGQLKWELEDIAFHYTNPPDYKKIAAFLSERRIDREKRIQERVSLLEEHFAKEKIKATIYGRAKHIYSIYLKAQKKQLSYGSIFDYSALRILVDTIDDCYTALSIVNSLWEQLPEEFDDYIAYPKPNGYRSIHTAVLDHQGKHLEIQIRTHDMHNEAEHGVAAHWIYKEEEVIQGGYESKITFLRQLLAWHRELAQHDVNPDKTFQEVFEDRIYVFTPAGDIVDLPSNATPLDFAYAIHSNLGHRCRGAKVNGHIVQLTHTLCTGDQVELITTKNGAPSRDWLQKNAGYVQTARARSKIAYFFRQQDVNHPKPLLDSPVSPRETHEEIINKSISKIAPVPITHVQISGIDDLLTRVAKCCKPIPGDLVIGYITQGRGVSIHRKDCHNLSHLTPAHQDRLVQVDWDSQQSGAYFVDLQIRAQEHEGLLKEIIALLANSKVDLIAVNSTVRQKDHLFFMIMTVRIHDITQLQQLIHQISQLDRVDNVKRLSK